MVMDCKFVKVIEGYGEMTLTCFTKVKCYFCKRK